MMFSTKVVGASTGILIPGQLGFRVGVGDELDGIGPAEKGSGDATSHDVQRRALPQSRALARWMAFLRHCLNPRASAAELSERFEQGDAGDERDENVPTGSPADRPDGDSPARSSSGEVDSQNRPGRRPNVSPHIMLIHKKAGIFYINKSNHEHRIQKIRYTHHIICLPFIS
jgi:hypothetical protein